MLIYKTLPPDLQCFTYVFISRPINFTRVQKCLQKIFIWCIDSSLLFKHYYLILYFFFNIYVIFGEIKECLTYGRIIYDTKSLAPKHNSFTYPFSTKKTLIQCLEKVIFPFFFIWNCQNSCDTWTFLWHVIFCV